MNMEENKGKNTEGIFQDIAIKFILKINGCVSSLHSGRLDESYVIQILKDKLKTKPCRSQGFVLDGFPKTYEQARELFGRRNKYSVSFL